MVFWLENSVAIGANFRVPNNKNFAYPCSLRDESNLHHLGESSICRKILRGICHHMTSEHCVHAVSEQSLISVDGTPD